MSATGKPIRRKDQRPAEIVAAALSIFLKQGFANARITDIAKAAGAAKGTVYLYFETKEDLFEAVVREHIQPLFLNVQQIALASTDSIEQLLTQIIQRMYREFACSAERRGIMRVLIAEGERFPELTAFYHREVIAETKRVLSILVQRGIERGELREAAARDFPATIMGPVILAAIWKMIFEEVEPLDIERFAAAHVDLVLHGLLSPPAEA